jgi:HEAT repeat protein
MPALRPVRWTAPAVLLTATLVLAQQPPAAPKSPAPPAGAPAAKTAPPGTPPAAPPAADKTPAGETKPPTAQPKFEWPKEVLNKSLAAWIADFKSKDPTVRDAAIKVIPLFGPEGRKAGMKGLLDLLNDHDPGVRINAMLILGSIGFDNKEDMHTAAARMAGTIRATAPGSMLRLHAARTLANMGPRAYTSDVMSAINGIVNDPSWETRQAVAAALGHVGMALYEEDKSKSQPAAKGSNDAPPVMKLKRPANTAAMSKLMHTLLKDDSAAVRMEALQSLIVLGPPHVTKSSDYGNVIKPYLAILTSRLKDEKDPGAKIWLRVVTMMYDDRAIAANVKEIAKAIIAPDPNLRVQALNALAVVGPKAKPVVEEITGALGQMENPPVVIAAASCLVTMGDAGKSAIPELEKWAAATKDADPKSKVLKEQQKAILHPIYTRAIAALKGEKPPSAAALAVPAKK